PRSPRAPPPLPPHTPAPRPPRAPPPPPCGGGGGPGPPADVQIAFLTRGSAGAVVAHDGRVDAVPAAGVPGGIEDLTGAGDLFAAGTLFGLRRGLEPPQAARVGAVCAAEVIGHHGARPEADLQELVASAGLL
ncbi:MAG: hypothetical protein F4Y06_07875, partial [Rhodospirillales bacterium]|nr:hypothetical protein [Rhodospirillales bacterium]